MKYAVIGTGAMGSVLGACLALGGGEVWFVDPFAAHMDAINEAGLSFEKNGEPHQIHGIRAMTDAVLPQYNGKLTIPPLRLPHTSDAARNLTAR